MHLNEGQMRAYHDGKLGDRRALAHLAACARCQAQAGEISQRARNAQDHLIILTPSGAEKPVPVQVARARLAQRNTQKENLVMWQRLFQPKYRNAWAVVTALVVLVVAFSFPQVRAAADSFLGLFRVERIQVVQVGVTLDEMPEKMSNYFQVIDQTLGDQIVVETEGEGRDLADAAEASAATGYTVRLPAQPVDDELRLVYQPAGTASIQIDRQLWQGLIDEMGYDYQVPEDVDGETITLHVENTINAFYGVCALPEAEQEQIPKYDQDCTIFTQMPVPTIDAPAGVDISEVGRVFLQAFGMSAEDATAVSQQIDWASTLVVPLPEDASYAEISVDGVQATLFEDQRNGESHYTIMWMRDGMFYAQAGSGDMNLALEMVNSLE
jgi:hypothetical protein